MASNIGANALATLTGNVEKAVIRIADDRLRSDQLKKQQAVRANGGATSNSISSIKDTDKLARLAAKETAQKAMKLSGAIMTKLENSLGKEAAAASPQYQQAKRDYENAKKLVSGDEGAPEYDKTFIVQFNPSTLTLSSFAADSDVEIQDFQKEGGGISKGSVELHVELSVQLVFDQMKLRQSFTEDTLNYSYSALARNLGGMAVDAIQANPNSVQTNVEGFMAALRNERTRRICFEWGKMKYQGILRNVNANYTMFDRYGKPVRATVGLKLYLRDQTVTPSDQGYWEEAYNRAFGSATGIITTQRTGQKVGALVGGLY